MYLFPLIVLFTMIRLVHLISSFPSLLSCPILEEHSQLSHKYRHPAHDPSRSVCCRHYTYVQIAAIFSPADEKNLIKAARHRSPGISFLKTPVPSRTQVLRDHLWTITIKLKKEDFVCSQSKNEFVRHLDRTQCAFVSLLVQW